MSDTENKDPVSINEWCVAAYENSKSKGWYDTDKDDVYAKLLLIHSEISEAVEELRNGHSLDEIYFGPNGKPEGFLIEMADALIRMLDICGRNKLDLEYALKIKHNYNKTRPHRHGGKAI